MIRVDNNPVKSTLGGWMARWLSQGRGEIRGPHFDMMWILDPSELIVHWIRGAKRPSETVCILGRSGRS